MTIKTGPKPVLDKEDMYLHILGVVMAQQFILKVGLKKFDDEERKAVSKEITQLHNKIAYVTVHPDKLNNKPLKNGMVPSRP